MNAELEETMLATVEELYRELAKARGERDEAIALATHTLTHMGPTSVAIVQAAADATRKFVEDETASKIASWIETEFGNPKEPSDIAREIREGRWR